MDSLLIHVENADAQSMLWLVALVGNAPIVVIITFRVGVTTKFLTRIPILVLHETKFWQLIRNVMLEFCLDESTSGYIISETKNKGEW